MKAILVSFIDSTNIGDRLIAEVLSKELLTGIETRKFSYKLLEDSQIQLDKNLVRRSEVHNIYYKYFRQLPFVKNLVSHSKWLKSRKKMYDPESIQRFEEALKQTDLLVIGGGNAIFDLSPVTLSAQRFDQVVTLAKQYQVPIFVSSIGIGPFCTEKQKQAAVETLKKCDYITFRDYRSWQYMNGSHHPTVYPSVDPVFLLPAEKSFEQLKAQRDGFQRIGICVIDYRITGCSQKEYLRYLKDLTALIQRLVDQQREIILFSSEVQDYETIETIYSEFQRQPQVKLVPIKDKEELLTLYQTLNLVIGTRMHSMIVAVSQYIPIIGLSWQQKVVEMFKNLSIENDVFPIEELHVNTELLIKKVDERLDNNQQMINQVKQAKEDMKSAFTINYQIMKTIQNSLTDL